MYVRQQEIAKVGPRTRYARQAANDVHRKQAAAEWRLDVRAAVAFENGRRARGYVWNEDAIMAREAHVLS